MDGDGEITDKDIELINKLVDEKESKIQTLIGDSNGDGVVDETDYENLKNYIENVDSSDDFIRKNSDVNGDGTIDEKDLQGIRDKLDGINVNYAEGDVLGDVNGDGKVTRADMEALNNYVNRESNGNDEFYINNADINGDGKIDKEDVNALRRQVEPRLRPGPEPRPRPVIIPGPIPPGPAPRPFVEPYKSWTDTSKRFQPIFTDADLSQRFGNEAIHVGIKISVIGETDRAYKVQYPTTGGDQVGWIGKNTFQRPTSIRDALQSLINEFQGKTWRNETTGRGHMESKDFAAFIFDQLNQVGYIGDTNRGNNFRININVNLVALRGSNEFLTKYNAKSLFRNAHIGDFVQMRTRYGDEHSAILTGVNKRGVYFLEANMPDSKGNNVYNQINLNFYKYEQLVIRHSSISLYYPKGEEV